MPRRLLIILLVAFFLRLALGLAHPFMFDDSADYTALGQAIATGHDYCTPAGQYASRMPGYPMLLAAVYLIFGTGPLGLHVLLALQALMGASVCYLVYRLARPLAETIAMLAALLAALDPLSIAFSAAMLTEVPFTLLLLLALLCLRDGAMQRNGWPTFFFLPLILAGAIYLRASFLPLAFVLLGLPLLARLKRWGGTEDTKYAALHRHDTPGALALRTLWVSLAVALLLAPWVIRNHLRPETRGLRLTSIEGISLYEAVYPPADGGPQQHKIALPPEMLPLTEGQRNHEWSRRAWHEISTHPAHVLALVPIKIARTWSPWLNAEDYRQPAAQLLLSFWHIPLYALALLSLTLPHLRKKLNAYVLLPVFYFTMLHALYLGSVRYRVPLMPLVEIAAAVALAGLLHKAPNPSPTGGSRD